MPAASLTRQFADALTACSAANNATLEKAEYCLLDFFASCYATQDFPWIQQVQQVARANSATPAGGAAIIGTPYRVSVQDAAFANAVAGHSLVRDDMHLGSVSHLGVVVIPAALALAAECPVTGQQFLEAIICGYEAGGRLGAMLMDVETAKVMRPTGLIGAFAAADLQLPDTSADNFGRTDVAAWWRVALGGLLGKDLSGVSDCEMLDSIQYAMFPNFGPWLGEGLPLMYQFLPLGDNPNESLFVVRLLAPLPDDGTIPPAAPMTYLDFDEPFSSIEAWGRVAPVFDQDMENLPLVQQGMRAFSPEFPNLTLGRYQEQRIAHMHEFIEAQIAQLTAQQVAQ